MFWLIENNTQLKEFYNKGYKEVFVEPIQYHDYIHPKLTDISLLYIRPVKGRKGFIISINHSEATSIKKSTVYGLLKTFDAIYVRNQKTCLYHFQLTNLVDISFNTPTLPEVTTAAHTFLYTHHPNKQDINKIVPIVKHYEKCESIYKQVKEHCYEKNKFYSKISKVFYLLENSGINIDEPVFNKYFDLDHSEYNVYNSRIYTNYNLHTTTGRPSNTFNTINFAALGKDSGCRKSFIPKNSKLIEIDISAYHPTLASQLVNYQSDDIYTEFANVAQIELPQAKELMFRQLYGGIMDEYKDWIYFKKIQSYIDKLWNQWKINSYIECPISNHIFHQNQLDNVNPNKLFNYVLQNMETSNNVNILRDILKILRDKNTKLILYTYDAFLFDIDDSEMDVMDEIKNVFNKYKLKTKNKIGTNYDF
jgi:hypothetical protein